MPAPTVHPAAPTRLPRLLAALALAAWLAGCGSPPLRPAPGAAPSAPPPPRGAVPPAVPFITSPTTDGPAADPPPGLLELPDAVPQLERLAQLTELAFDELAAALAPVEQRIPVSRVPAQRKRATPKSRKNKAALAA